MIRPFQPGDIYLIQRLGRQATHLPCAHNFLQPKTSTAVALSAVLPWTTMGALTYVLRQQGHGLVHEGFLQVKRRAGRPEAEILTMAPSLDAPAGHPAIWNKLLSHLVNEAGGLGFERIYAEAPDQPLVVNTFAAVGFQPFCRQTIWRRFSAANSDVHLEAGDSVQPRLASDDWALLRLYTTTVPEPVRVAEGAFDVANAAPILENLRPDHGVTYTLRTAGELVGAFQLRQGRCGVWLHFWADMLQPHHNRLSTLIEQALAMVARQGWSAPLYVASSDYHGGLEVLLEAYGFAPFLDRVRMVKHVVKWARESVASSVPVVETASEVVPTSFAPPGAVASSIRISTTTTDSGSTA